MKSTRCFLLFVLMLALPTVAAYAEARLLAGPMVGPATATTASIWVETSQPAEVRIDYWQQPLVLHHYDVHEPIATGSATGRTARDYPHTGVVNLKNLAPGWLVYYRVFVDGEETRALTPQVFSPMPSGDLIAENPDESNQFVMAFGSCTRPHRIPVQRIWAEVARHRPAAFLFLGDANYFPGHPEHFERISREMFRAVAVDIHRTLRNLPGLREIVATTPTYAVWDDHDYGDNNSDRLFRFREDSLEMFERYWPNPRTTHLDTPGVFHTFRLADAQFFMLDNRYYRDPDDAPDRKTHYGAGQLAWLKEELKQSDATFKVIASGGTMLADVGKHETWVNHGAERDEFLAWLFAENITGVFFIVGDWHMGGLVRLHREEDAYPLYELMSSNLGIRPERARPDPMVAPPGYDEGLFPIVNGYQFGALRFHGDPGDRKVALQIVTETGETPISHTLSEHDLVPRG